MTAMTVPSSIGRPWSAPRPGGREPVQPGFDHRSRSAGAQVRASSAAPGGAGAKVGCQVEFLDRPMSDDPNDQLLLQIRGAVAEYERSLIAERMRRGRPRGSEQWAAAALDRAALRLRAGCSGATQAGWVAHRCGQGRDCDADLCLVYRAHRTRVAAQRDRAAECPTDPDAGQEPALEPEQRA